jgi:hypothetical protein
VPRLLKRLRKEKKRMKIKNKLTKSRNKIDDLAEKDAEAETRAKFLVCPPHCPVRACGGI